jgi:heme/copper-type cytochrome/quinol oxidase subunit 2
VTNRARVGVMVGTVLILGGLFLVLRPKEDAPTSPSPAVSTEVPVADASMDHASGEHMHTLVVKDGAVTGDRRISLPQGTEVMLVVKSDVADVVHVHGYDVKAEVTPDQPATITLTADVTGTFEVELEDSGLLLTELEVTP